MKRQHILMYIGFLVFWGSRSLFGESTKSAVLLHEMYLASGGEHWNGLAQIRLRGKYRLGGVDGTFEQIVNLKSGADVFSFQIGPLSGRQGDQPLGSWAVDQSGLVTVEDAPEARADAITQTYINRNGWFDPEVGASTHYMGKKRDKGQTFDLVEVTPAGGRAITLWIGAIDHLLRRIDQKDANQHESSTLFSDYRVVQGVQYPFAVAGSTGDPSQDSVQSVTSINISRAVKMSAFARPASKVRDARLLGKLQTTKIPFTISNDRIVIQVALNGGSPLPFVLDSGAVNILTPLAAKSLGVVGVGNLGVTGSGSNQESATVAQIKMMHLGDAELTNQQFIITALPSFVIDRGKQAPVAGLIGFELLRRFPISINYQEHTLLLFSPGAFPKRPLRSKKLRLYFNDRTPFIQIRVDGVPAYFGIDTGDNGGVTLFNHFYQAHHFPVQLPGIQKQRGGIGGETASLLTRIGRLSIQGWTLRRPIVSLNFAQSGLFAFPLSGGNLGYGILRRFIATFDYGHRQLYLERSAEFATPPQYNRSGLTLAKTEDGAVKIDKVDPNTPGAKAGLLPGDLILAINGKTLGKDPLYETDTVLSEETGTLINISFIRAGEKRHAQFLLAELIPANGLLVPFQL